MHVLFKANQIMTTTTPIAALRQMTRAFTLAAGFIAAAAYTPAFAQGSAATPAPVSGTAGQVEATRGATTIQSVRGGTQIAGKGSPLAEGDRISTGENGIALIRLLDGTRMTIRPNSQLVLDTVKYSAPRNEGSLVLSLLRGGLRAVTGAISKTAPNVAQIRTTTATIGIRGTEFDARICEEDCARDNVRTAKLPSAPARMLAAGRVVRLSAPMSARDANGIARNVSDGGPVYPGDTVQTSAGYAILAFRDQTRMALAPNTQFKVRDFVYDMKQPQEGRFGIDILRGTLRFVTGLVGKARPDNVQFRATTATIGIRGTDGLIQVNERGEVQAQTIDGLLVMDSNGVQSEIAKDVCLISNVTAQATTARCAFAEVLNPNDEQIDFDKLFAQTPSSGEEPGVYVFIWGDGHVRLENEGQSMDLAAGELGYTDGKRFLRPAKMPGFIEFDNTPKPSGDSLPLDITAGLGAAGLQNEALVCK